MRPLVMSRADWGANDAYLGPVMDLPSPELWLHHTVTATEPELAVVRRVEAEASRPDLAYRFPYTWVIFPTGNIWEGQGWGHRGAHTPGHNYGHAISLAGNYDELTPTDAQIDAVRWLITDGIRRGALVPSTYPTGGHRDVMATACPGANAYALLDRFRQPWVEPTPPPEPVPEEDSMLFYHSPTPQRYHWIVEHGGPGEFAHLWLCVGNPSHNTVTVSVAAKTTTGGAETFRESVTLPPFKTTAIDLAGRLDTPSLIEVDGSRGGVDTVVSLRGTK